MNRNILQDLDAIGSLINESRTDLEYDTYRAQSKLDTALKIVKELRESIDEEIARQAALEQQAEREKALESEIEHYKMA